MHIRKLLAIVILGLGVSAAADFTTVTAAYEVAVSDLRLPRSTGGTLSFKECSDCAAQTLRVSGETRYVLNDRSYTLVEFTKQVKGVSNKKDETATVMHHLESNTITAIFISL